jgi:hypothetical protein
LKPFLLSFGLAAAVLVWLFAPALTGGASFPFRDAAHYYHPLFEYIRGEWGAGRVPLWNPYENSGLPILGENTSSVFYPGKLLFALPFDYTWLYNMYIVGHVALAAATAYRLARYWGTSQLASGLAALAYGFGGSVLFQYCNVVFLVGSAWLPLAIEFSDRMIAGKTYWAAVGFGLVLALMILGGDPQMAYNAGLLALVRAWVGRTAVDRAGWLVRTILPRLLAAAAVAGLLAAVQILPTMEASRLSARAMYDAPRNIYEAAEYLSDSADRDTTWYGGFLRQQASTHQRQIYQFSLEPWRLIELLWPNITGLPFSTNRRWLSALGYEGNLWTASLYMGLAPVVLALSAWSIRRAAPVEVRFCSWMVVMGIVGSLGMFGLAWLVGLAFGGSELVHIGGEVGGLYWFLVTFLPGYVQFRYPTKLFPIASLGLAILAAYGWDRLWIAGKTQLVRVLAVLAVISLLLLVGAFAARSWLESFVPRQEAAGLTGRFDGVSAWRDLAGALLHTTVVAALLAVLVQWARKPSARALVLQSLALCLTALDLAWAQWGLILFAPSEDWRGAPAIVGSLPPDPDNYRIFRQLGPLPAAWSETPSDTRYDECLKWSRQTLMPKYPLPLRLALVEASSTMGPADYQFLLDLARRRQARSSNPSGLPADEVLDLLSARIAIAHDSSQKGGAFPSIIRREPAPEAPLASTTQHPQMLPMGTPSDDMIAYLRPLALPRAWIVHQVEQRPVVRPRSEKAIKQLTNDVLFPGEDARNWRQMAVVETDEPMEATIEPFSTDAQETCQITYADPVRVELEVRLESGGLVVLGDLFYPGWELMEETGGRETRHKILRVNRVQRGVALAAGEYHLIFRYRPTSVLAGAIASGASIVGFSLVGAVHLLRRRRARLDANAPAEATQI